MPLARSIQQSSEVRHSVFLPYTCLGLTFLVRNLLLSSMMNATSSSVGLGVMVMSEGESVVPQMVLPSHGRKNSTRPSFVCGWMVR